MIIEKPGLLSTIQDLGRNGYKRYGVITSGAMDQLAHRIANMLVLNGEKEETVEMTMIGPEIRFQEDAVIAITGGNLSPSINGHDVKMYRPITVRDGDVLSFGRAVSGIRSYLAVHGGFSIERVMQSGSTYLKAGIGGYKGRALKKGDELRLKKRISLEQKRNLAHPKVAFFRSAGVPSCAKDPSQRSYSACAPRRLRTVHTIASS